MTEAPQAIPDELLAACFASEGSLKETGELQDLARKELASTLASRTLCSDNIVRLLVLLEALAEGGAVNFPGSEQVHIFTPLSRVLKSEEVIRQYDYDGRRWYRPPEPVPAKSANLVILTNPETGGGKSGQKLFLALGQDDCLSCYHYGLASSPEGLPEDVPISAKDGRVLSGNQLAGTSYGYRADGVYYTKDDFSVKRLKGVLIAMADQLGVKPPDSTPADLRGPISNFLPEPPSKRRE